MGQANQPDITAVRRGFLIWEQAQGPHLQQSVQAAAALASACATEGLPVSASAAPLPPLNHVTIPAVAVEVAPSGSLADELAAPEYQRRITAALATAIASLRGQLEGVQ
jgi:N-acetylmuramoyl-L-alanine amidase